MRRLGFVLLCVYIAFNVLDIDGSDSPYRLGPALTPATAAAEADRGLLTTPLPGPAGSDAAVLTADSRLRLDPVLTRAHPLQIQRPLLRRPSARLEASTSSTPPTDPA